MKTLFSFFSVFLFMSCAYAEQDLNIMTEEFAPYQFYEGEGGERQITGISIEIVRAIQQKIGNADEIKVLPWSRAIKILKNKKNSLLFSTARTPARENLFKWIGPVSEFNMMFFKKKGSSVNFTSLEEARKIGKIGVTKNVATHEILRNNGFKNLDVLQSGSDAKNIKRLLKGRIDVWPTGYYAGIYSAKKLGVRDDIEVIPNVSILSGKLYIAVNIETNDSVVTQWQAALDELVADGSVKNIVQAYER